MELERLKDNAPDKLCRFINPPVLHLSLSPKHARGKAEHTHKMLKGKTPIGTAKSNLLSLIEVCGGVVFWLGFLLFLRHI